MPLRSLVMFLVFVGLATIAVIEYMKVGSLTKEVSSLTQELNGLKEWRPAAPAAPAARRATKIVCPLCHGEKVIVLDPTGRNNPLYRKTRSCPVCLGVGYRMLTIPPEMKICSDCQGMGLVYSPAQAGQWVQTGYCARCSGTGLVADVK